MNTEKWTLFHRSPIWKSITKKSISLVSTLKKYCTNLHPDQGAILILLRPEMKSTFHHTLIALAIVDILFLLTLIVDSQVEHQLKLLGQSPFHSSWKFSSYSWQNINNCHQKGKAVNNKGFFFFHPESWPWLEEPDVHLALSLRVEPFEEHPDDLRDLPHDEHHHRAILGHQKSTWVQSGRGEDCLRSIDRFRSKII